ncbi:enoyl-CoA hydratase/isomerase family protein [Hoeflea sp. WL0058]|uniref:Enoyl-CoA hydratase/isomerase family protein n=1 Tax=Flavimaribacter sediminis TaxID=2865987 RepID=A0AAE2ZQ66_9HYPH|nr:enoyl-CoA hydratase-related protein [Flavimaribacter sediminis]MBW8638712.1 enoyl-CoA hydratase/isomerase family protein [Flavimaribacter sediminis]
MSIDLLTTGHIARITLNRPERMNALDGAHYTALAEAWTAVRDDDAIRAVVVTGSGDKAFCAGADLNGFTNTGPPLSELWNPQQGMLLNRGIELYKPVLAAVNGYCLGGGMTLLMATDLRLAIPSATFAVTEVKRGVIAANGGTQRILKQLPHAIGMELLLTGRSMDAEEALHWGLINRIVPKEQLDDAAMELAEALAANAPLAMRASKELALRSYDMDLQAGLRAEQMANRLMQTTQDVKEGARAFAEKRPPVFKGK